MDLLQETEYPVDSFCDATIQVLLRKCKKLSTGSIETNDFEVNGFGSQEQANLAWSIVVTERYTSESLELLQILFNLAVCDNNMQAEHAHQLWQGK